MASRAYRFFSNLKPIATAGAVATAGAWVGNSKAQEPQAAQKDPADVPPLGVNLSNQEWLQFAELLLEKDELGDAPKRKQLVAQICQHVRSQISQKTTADNSKKLSGEATTKSEKGAEKNFSSADTLVDPKNDFHLSLSMSEFFPTQQHLLHQALSGSDKLEKYDVLWYPRQQVIQAKVRFGRNLSGHPGIVHGGAIASVFDDAFGVLFFSLRIGTGFTANLNVNYRSPIHAGRDVLYQVKLEEVDGKKVRLKASAYDAENRSHKYADATALFIVKHVPSSSNALEKMKEYLTQLEQDARSKHEE